MQVIDAYSGLCGRGPHRKMLHFTDQFLLTTIFCRPGNLNLARRRASSATAVCASLQRMDSKIWPMHTRAHTPNGLPNAPRMPAGRQSHTNTAPRAWHGFSGPSSSNARRCAGVEVWSRAWSRVCADTPTCLQPIRARARKHLVDAQHMEGVHANAQVEGVLAGILCHVLVGSDARSLQCL